MMRRLFSTMIIALVCGTPAFADDDKAGVSKPDIAGEWAFTARTGEDCSFSGTALLTPTENPSEYACELTARQACSFETWQVRQSCKAYRTDSQLVISSKIEEFLSGEPDGRYRPDNFNLQIKSADFMKGALVSWGVHIAEFRRPDGAIS